MDANNTLQWCFYSKCIIIGEKLLTLHCESLVKERKHFVSSPISNPYMKYPFSLSPSQFHTGNYSYQKNAFAQPSFPQTVQTDRFAPGQCQGTKNPSFFAICLLTHQLNLRNVLKEEHLYEQFLSQVTGLESTDSWPSHF